VSAGPPAAGGAQMLRADRLLTPFELLAPAWLEIRGGVITGLGAGAPPRAPDRDLGDVTVIPGMVDMHTHGGGGHDMAGNDPVAIRAALAWSLRRGVTASVLSTVSAPLDTLVDAIAIAADLVREDQPAPAASGAGARARLLGVHLEGPFLSPLRRGAHRERDLRPPSTADVERLLSTAPGTVLMVTVAPELGGGIEAVRAIRDSGAVAALGHTDADADTTAAAVGVGARVATHLFNGMRGMHHREPGPAGALLAADGVTCELINDGRHLHPAMVAIAARAAGRGRIALITDAVAATGAPDGHYRLGPLTVVQRDGEVRVTDSADPTPAGDPVPAGEPGPAAGSATATDSAPAPDRGSLAGGAAGLDGALRRAVTVIGIPLADAVAAVTSTPAAALGVADRVGSLAVGRRADLCVLNSDLIVRAVCSGGNWIELSV
jgi:N-acetylglucosamine-6-phosphate deacetylase